MTDQMFSLHLSHMERVYDEVEKAIKAGDSPFAALITDPAGQVVAIAANQSQTKWAIAHAETEAIQQACQKLRVKKLVGFTLYANAESCAMCSAAIIKAGITGVFYGAPHEAGSSPDLYLREVNLKATAPLEIHAGLMEAKFQEQIRRGRR